MVKCLTTRAVIGCLLIFIGNFVARGTDFSAWKIGDIASEDVSTPIALDVVDAKSTAAHLAELALQAPAIFLTHGSVTNEMVDKVTESFDEARAKFVAGFPGKFSKPVLDQTLLQSDAFKHYVSDFNAQNERFLISTDMARQWALGQSADATRDDLIRLLLKTTSRPIRPDDTPDGFVLGNTVRLVPVHSSRDVVTLKDAEKHGEVVTLESVTTVTRLRGLFRRNFSSDEQDFARQLATYIRPDCELDVALSEQARDKAKAGSKVVYMTHFAPGQVIVRRGQLVDEPIYAALVKLGQQLPLAQVTPETAPVQKQNPPEALVHPQPQQQSQLQAKTSETESHSVNIWMMIAPAGGAVILLAGVGVLLIRRQAAKANRLAVVPVPQNASFPAELAPQIAQVLRSAVAQELAAQRQELMLAQQTAAAEVLRIIQRLNDVHAPWQERQAAYEKRIHELEKELTLRTEENRELLKLKIELLREQLEAERGNRRINFN